MGLWICQTGTLDAVRPMGLRPHGDDDGGIVGITWVQEGDATKAKR